MRYLSSGGMIVNYRCPAACGHCMYGCSPNAEPGYMTETVAAELCKTLRRLGCPSLHIGGGEPFLDIDGLSQVIKTITDSGLQLDYIETNAAWITDDTERNKQILSNVLKAGGDCIMVSADPFHVEFIPFWKPAALISILEEMNISHFIWQQRYLPMLMKLDPQKRYNSVELKQKFGYDVTTKSVREYGMGFNGRALNLLRKMTARKDTGDYLSEAPCNELQNGSHFHVDFLGRYIPPGCTGMGILLKDLSSGLNTDKYPPDKYPPDKYPVMSRLLSGGVKALWDYALARGYEPDPEGYVSKCELCFSLRKHLITTDPDAHPDLTPASFYKQNY